MRVQQRKPRQRATITPRGPLNVGPPVERLRREILALLDEGVHEVRIDAGRVPYADGSGLGTLAECARLALEAGISLRIERAQGKFRQELEMTGLIDGRRRRRGRKTASGEARSFRPDAGSCIRALEPGVA